MSPTKCGITFRQLISPYFDGEYASTQRPYGPTGNFVQFASGYFTLSNLTKQVKHPRPEAETNSYAISRRWYPGLVWRIPVCVDGLAWPMGFSVNGPEGMSFVEAFPVLNEVTGEYEIGGNAGYLEWANPILGNHEYTITVKGQEGSELQVTSTLTVTTSDIYFVSPTGNNSNDGSYANPKRDIEEYFDGTYNDITVIALGGSYTPTGNLLIQTNYPKVICGEHGNTPTFDMSSGQFPMNAGSDICFGNINFNNSDQTLAQSRIIYGTTNWSDGHRFLGFDLDFQNFDIGSVGDDNPGPISILAPAVYRDYFCLSNISIDNSIGAVNGSVLGSFYQLRNSYLDNYTIGSNVSSTRGCYLKAGCWDFGVHRVKYLAGGNFNNGPVSIGLGTDGDGQLQNDLIEVSYCKVKSDNFSDHYAVRHQGAVVDAGNPRVYIFRNNIFGRVGYGGSTSTASIVNINDNIVMSQFASPIQPSAGNITVNDIDNYVGDETSGYLDSNLDVAGDAETNYAGQRGANMYSGVQHSGQLPVENYVAAKMPMTAVLPRPDVETNTNDYQSNAHVDEEYVLPIVIQGGTWIWRIVVNSIPTGATIGTVYGTNNYGVIKWTPVSSQVGNNSFDITVYGQDGASLNLQWTVNVNTTHCIFASITGNDTTGDGSRNNPYETFEYAVSQCTNGQLLRLGEGTFYQTTLQEYSTTACNGIVGVSRDTTIIDSSGIPTTGTDSKVGHLTSSGFYTAHINYDNISANLPNPRWFVSTSSQANSSRITQYDCKFTRANNGTLDDDNTSCLFLGNNYGVPRLYIAVVGNQYDSLPLGTNGFSALDFYTTSYAVIENNITSGSGNPRYFIWSKGPDCNYLSIRGNTFDSEWGGKLIDMYMAWVADTTTSGYTEIAYNYCKSSAYDSGIPTRENAPLVLFGASQTSPTSRGPIWSYRNTWWGFAIGSRRTYEVEFHGDSDVIVNEVATTWDDKYMIYDPNDSSVNDPELEANITYSSQNNELHGNFANGYIASSGKLTGVARDTYVYTRGHEIGGFL